MAVYTTLEYKVQNGRVLFKIQSRKFFGLIKQTFEATTDTTGYKNSPTKTVVLSWPACETYSYINPVCTFVNQELTRLQIQGVIKEEKSYHYVKCE